MASLAAEKARLPGQHYQLVPRITGIQKRIAQGVSVSPSGRHFAFRWQGGFSSFGKTAPLPKFRQSPAAELRNQLTGMVTRLRSKKPATSQEEKKRIRYVPTCFWPGEHYDPSYLDNALEVYSMDAGESSELKSDWLMENRISINK